MEQNLATAEDMGPHQERRGFFGDFSEIPEEVAKRKAAAAAREEERRRAEPFQPGIWRIAFGVLIGNALFAVLSGLFHVWFR